MEKEKKVIWGIIGCGDVAEVKSGPAFQKIKHSELRMVMRRDAEKAQSFARRHHVPHWTNDAKVLLNDYHINAVYIATPPSTHLEYARLALKAGKNIYLEKPMVRNLKEATQLLDLAKESDQKITVAHYRRALPAFQKVKSLIEKKAIGDIRLVEIQMLQSAKNDLIASTDENWRVDPKISGGGYFFDLAPHQLDLMLNFFGKFEKRNGIASNQSKVYQANDMVNALGRFENGVHFTGTWAFNVNDDQCKDVCKIYGSDGMIKFSFYGDKVYLTHKGKKKKFRFENPQHIQYPMISKTVDYFLDIGPNPCSIQEGQNVIESMEIITS
ncbi:Gfo/Idh/MocA family protein [Portibacter lacus]|uniref:Oxidoreductase n=1 Tax=Portibacter lacus TaxID=1099794 RepID=A0AA37WIP0_9BACT|nr:Gfo/Idh/MocA family oxidoreductase [Portibacter lacus]GLR20040.1 oxidoreductase [Portibacter lacus]